MTITTYTGGMVETNGYIVQSETGAVVVDAPLGILSKCHQLGVRPDALLLTHQHFDHVEDVPAMAAAGIPIYAASNYSQGLVLDQAAREWGLPISVEPFEVTHLLAGETALELAGISFEIAAVPGHSPDSLVFHVALFQKLFAGDTVFAGSIGRTDLPGGEHDLLIRGIREHVLTLPGETAILPGHGPGTTVCKESVTNPFLT